MTKEQAGKLMQLIAENIAAQKDIPFYTDSEFTSKLAAANSAERAMWSYFKGLIHD